MNTTAPGKSKIFLMVAFAASCIGLLLYLWISFGGSVPFVPQGYRVTVEFNQAVQLGTQADVEIAGVSIGKVVEVGLDRGTGLTKAVLQIDPRFAPRPANTRAILREKTLLGETYVELSFGNPHGPMLRDGARLPQAHVASTVQLDQILNTFDPKTRRAFETWMQDDGEAFTDRGEEFNDALARLVPFSTNVNNVLEVLRRDGGATRTLLSDGGRVLSALSQNPTQLQGLIRNANSVFAATAAQGDDLAASIRTFPDFLASTRETLNSVKQFSADAEPLIKELQPAATPLSAALERSTKLAPPLKTVMIGLGPLTKAAQAGIPALDSFLDVSTGAGSSKTLLTSLTPFLGQLIPVIDYVDAYRREIATFFANSTAATQAAGQSFDNSTERLHYVRVSAPLSPEELTAQSKRPYSDRSNAYGDPGSARALSASSTLDVFGSYLCTGNPLPAIPSGSTAAVQYQTQLPLFYGGGADATKVPTPACTVQQKLSAVLEAELGGSLGPKSGFYPQLQPLP